jgi:glucan phosphoethanolaminetransferase (alkaline phosphatase superfamily)
MKTWKICFEDQNGNLVDELDFSNYAIAKRHYDEIILEHFQKVVLIRDNGTLLVMKTKYS